MFLFIIIKFVFFILKYFYNLFLLLSLKLKNSFFLLNKMLIDVFLTFISLNKDLKIIIIIILTVIF